MSYDKLYDFVIHIFFHSYFVFIKIHYYILFAILNMVPPARSDKQTPTDKRSPRQQSKVVTPNVHEHLDAGQKDGKGHHDEPARSRPSSPAPSSRTNSDGE